MELLEKSRVNLDFIWIYQYFGYQSCDCSAPHTSYLNHFLNILDEEISIYAHVYDQSILSAVSMHTSLFANIANIKSNGYTNAMLKIAVHQIISESRSGHQISCKIWVQWYAILVIISGLTPRMICTSIQHYFEVHEKDCRLGWNISFQTFFSIGMSIFQCCPIFRLLA